MIARNADLPVIFMHIPKTAGSTLRQLIKRNYAGQELYFLGEVNSKGGFGNSLKASISALEQMSKEKLAEIKIVLDICHLVWIAISLLDASM